MYLQMLQRKLKNEFFIQDVFIHYFYSYLLLINKKSLNFQRL